MRILLLPLSAPWLCLASSCIIMMTSTIPQRLILSFRTQDDTFSTSFKTHEEEVKKVHLLTTLCCLPRRLILAILGDNETLSTSLNMPPRTAQRGIRVLTIDGGGVKGICAIRMLADIERRLDAPLHRCFDLIVGTSAGAIIATAIGRKMKTTQLEGLYKSEQSISACTLSPPPAKNERHIGLRRCICGMIRA